jgi:hypothetical protein
MRRDGKKNIFRCCPLINAVRFSASFALDSVEFVQCFSLNFAISDTIIRIYIYAVLLHYTGKFKKLMQTLIEHSF